VQQLAAGGRARLGGRIRGLEVEAIGGRDELRDGTAGVAGHDEQRPITRIAQIQCGLKEAHRQRIVTDRFGPEAVLRLQIQ
jgi:hypothetical protein